ncbi:hypothetical protein BDV96DRAFT_642080 [Lophiotrema nucula]|uniref:Uncharacterized protein n=1 Tax=Lophiotrema nucula TaxID=690887 RepID=A0A6A5ZMK0_9PLEO|nr:hypothetical protein BDV96DRAFT_642080 [Lophiotrema nucula]
MEQDTEILSKKVHQLPRPNYPPIPANIFKRKLLNGVSQGNFNSHCLCPACAQSLWDGLAQHPKNLTLLSTSVKDIVIFARQHAEDLQLDAHTIGYLRTFKSVFGRLKKLTRQGPARYVCYPPLAHLAEPLNQIFFSGVLEDVKYTWYNTSETSLSRWGSYEQTYAADDRLKSSEIFVHPVSRGDLLRFPGIETEEGQTAEEYVEYAATKIIEIILHEQTHALIKMYACQGQCKSSQDFAKRALCNHLDHHMSHLWSKFVYQKEWYGAPAAFTRHGPAFWEVVNALYPGAERLLNIQFRGCYGYAEADRQIAFIKEQEPELYAKLTTSGFQPGNDRQWKEEQCWCRYGQTPLMVQIICQWTVEMRNRTD